MWGKISTIRNVYWNKWKTNKKTTTLSEQFQNKFVKSTNYRQNRFHNSDQRPDSNGRLLLKSAPTDVIISNHDRILGYIGVLSKFSDIWLNYWLELGLGQTSLDVDLRKWKTFIYLRIGRLSESYIYMTVLSPGLVQALQLNLPEITYIYPNKPPPPSTEMIQSCKCFQHSSKIRTVTYKWVSSVVVKSFES